MTLALYVLFFLSGAASLAYQVAWARSLSLVFGGSHLAITTVLAVFMGGLALGAALFGRRAESSPRPLRLYGFLELGVAASAAAFLLLSRIYPSLYGPLARLAEENRLWLTTLRVGFAVLALAVPTTLMGGTLPVLSRFVARRGESLGRHLSLLYSFNTLGAVAGTAAAGFVLLRSVGVTATVVVAMLVNVAVGAVALALPAPSLDDGRQGRRGPAPAPRAPGPAAAPERSQRLVLWGIGVSGFCALGYEVLWTRMLSMVVGTSVYSFTIILIAFLTGIAAGSWAYGLLARRAAPDGPRRAVLGFAAVQLTIGLAALTVTLLMRDLPAHATWLQQRLAGGATEFAARQGATLVVALAYLFVPAFFMGVAFPLAGAIWGERRGSVSGAVGDVLTWNTVGAILGSALSGFVLVYALGVERSLHVLVALNVSVGAVVAAGLLRRPAARWPIWAAAAALLVALVVNPRWGRTWDERYFAVFRNNQRDAFDTAAKRREAVENTEILYYHEGVNETISVIRPRGAMQAFVVNGRPEASTSPIDVQLQRTLGHLPTLLHPHPRKVFVLGTGTGMTLGSTSLHPEVERIVLAEIEPAVLGAARTFAEHNHGVLDDPRLHVVFNDGRNHLATTREKFDVITADPIHPWSGGAAYLYTREYFDSVAAHLEPGGLAAQWLPIYELTPRDIATVVRTFAGSFRHVMIWLTYYDAELLGSDAPIVIDEARLARRMAHPPVAADLGAVDMAPAEAFLSWFVAGTEGARAFGRAGVVNTDDNLFLEFSAPESVGVGGLMVENVTALAAIREGLLPHLAPAPDEAGRAAQRERWERNLAAGRAYDDAHARYMRGEGGTPAFAALLDRLEREHPGYAPIRFLSGLHRRDEAGQPTLAGVETFPVRTETGARRLLQLAAVSMRIGDARAVVMFVDNERREVYGQRYLDAAPERLDQEIQRVASETLGAAAAAYREAAAAAGRRGEPLPAEGATTALLRERVAAETATR